MLAIIGALTAATVQSFGPSFTVAGFVDSGSGILDMLVRWSRLSVQRKARGLDGSQSHTIQAAERPKIPIRSGRRSR